ncbi:MAG: U32 family peptidase [Opitutales bacterium]|nr:U32 family peptidase [Opitutales bacterium]
MNELLLPAGTLTRLKIADYYGADAVYCGLPSLSLRAGVGLTREELEAGIVLLHGKGKKIYLALNLFSKNEDWERLPDSVALLRELSPDGVIVSDPAIFMFLREHAPELPLHISTQANVSSYATVEFWKKLGARLCVLSRETSFGEIEEIRSRVPGIGLEMFIHGAMCMSYSGRCLLSAFMTGRSANRGRCAQSCRWEYNLYLEEQKRPGELIKVEEDPRGTYFMNSRDLCLMPDLPRILSAGIDSLKIEGRNKSDYYVAQTARIYRLAIDDWRRDPENWRAEPYLAELATMQNRGYTRGFFDGVPGASAQNYETSVSRGSAVNVGMVIEADGSPKAVPAGTTEKDWVRMDVRNKMSEGETIEFLFPQTLEPLRVRLDEIYDGVNGKRVPAISAGRANQTMLVPVSALGGKIPAALTMVRKMI